MSYINYVAVSGKDDFFLESRKQFGPITVAYETYGDLNSEKNNCILILHALTGDSHPARHFAEDREGWWEEFLGPGKMLDTDTYFIVCSNVLGGCQGSTGPSSIDEATGRPYGSHFPIITIRDMINVQKKLLDKLGIEHLHCVIGGSMGGLQVLQWAVDYPDFIDGAIQIASPVQLSAEAIGINHIMRTSIMADSNWNNGDYYDGRYPEEGLAIARMLGMVTYQTYEEYERKFRRKTKSSLEAMFSSFEGRFEVESYLNYQGAKFNDRFDANSYLYITRAMDLFDLKRQYGSLENALRRITSPYLLISIDSDRLFYLYEMRKSYTTLKAAGVEICYEEISSPYGHDSFLIDGKQFKPIITDYLSGLAYMRNTKDKLSFYKNI